jgi:serine/threonine-protein kinase
MMIGQKIGQFEIHKELGSGAMGTVYKATLDAEGKSIPVALKVVAVGLLGNEGALTRFDREAKILKQLRHPHIVRLIATGRYHKTPFIAMEFVDGEPLDRLLHRRGKLGWEEVVSYAKQLCEALQYAHEKGIIHRDLKPSNLMLAADGVLKLTDFGIAKDTDVTALTGANNTIGTAAYMSPEQCKGDRHLTAKSDLYSLGIVLYELVTGKKPFVSESSVEMFLKHVNEVPVRPSRHAPDLPVWLDNLIMFLLEKEKDSRPLDAETVSRMLADIEAKVQSQQSAGAEVANARRIDRLPRDGALSAEDREVARMMRAAGKGKRRKKKADPWYTRPWLKAVPPVIGLAAVAVGLFYAFKPVPKEKQLARIEAAETDEGKIKFGDAYLSRYGGLTDETTEKVRAIVTEAKGKAWEATLSKRFFASGLLGAGMKRAPEGEDESAYDMTMRAMEAERAGRPAEAAAMWGQVKAHLGVSAETRKAEWIWVADKRIKDGKDAADEFDRLKKEYRRIQIEELPWKFDPNDAKSLATLAYRLDAFGDKPKAHDRWQSLAGETERKTDKVSWYVLATQQAAVPVTRADDPSADRVRRIGEYLDETRKLAEAAPRSNREKAILRDCRNRCRDVIELYSDETDGRIKDLVTAAKAMQDSLPKAGGE